MSEDRTIRCLAAVTFWGFGFLTGGFAAIVLKGDGTMESFMPALFMCLLAIFSVYAAVKYIKGA
jgi:hypothetical protein